MLGSSGAQNSMYLPKPNFRPAVRMGADGNGTVLGVLPRPSQIPGSPRPTVFFPRLNIFHVHTGGFSEIRGRV